MIDIMYDNYRTNNDCHEYILYSSTSFFHYDMRIFGKTFSCL